MKFLVDFAVLFSFVATAMAQPREEDNYRNFVFQEKFELVTLIGGLCCLGFTVLTIVAIIFRDILQVWTCFGMTEVKRETIPTRTLTFMSAAYLANTDAELAAKA